MSFRDAMTTRPVQIGLAAILLAALGTLLVVRFDVAHKERLSARASRNIAAAVPTPPESSPRPPSADTGFLGVVVTRESVDVSARVDGRVEQVHVRLGDRVQRNAPLARLDVRTLEQDLAMARAALQSAAAEQQQAALELADAKERVERMRHLRDVVSAEQFATAHSQENIAAARVESARAQAAERGARVSQLQQMVTDAEIRAPFDGVVAARYLDAGTTITRGTPVVRLISPGELWVRFAAPEENAARLQIGQTVNVRTGAPELVVSSTIENIAPEVDTALRMVIIEARLTLDEQARRRIAAGGVARVFLN